MHTPKTGPRLQESIALPVLGGIAPGPMHTVLLDEEGRLYYSDEFNDAVVCLDGQRQVCWYRNAPRTESAGFFYPRGMSLGWISTKGQTIRCLAVCDAWKHRVQILDLSGNTLAIWTQCGSTPFSEPCDVRYIQGNTSLEGYWLILDRGNHRICALAQDGESIFAVGRCLTPSLSEGWDAPGIGLEEYELPAGLVNDFSRFDFVYFPSRILGSSEHALYVSEPASQRLKQLLLGNLFPISVRPSFPFVNWIDADITGLLGYCRETGSLLLYNKEGDLWRETHLEQGTPIASNLTLSEFWTQTGDHLDRWSWSVEHDGELKYPEPDRRRSCGALLRTAQDSMSVLDSDAAAIGGVTSVFERAIALADECIAGVQNGTWDRDLINRTHEKLPKLAEERIRTGSAVHKQLHHWHVGRLVSRLLPDASAGDVHSGCEKWRALIAPVHAKFGEVQRRLDDLSRLRWSLEKAVFADLQVPETLQNVINCLEGELLEWREWLYGWFGIRPATAPVLSFADAWSEAEGAINILRFPREVQRHKPTSSFIKETGILSISARRNTAPLQPHSLVLTGDGDLLVSLANDHRVIRMDMSGRLLDSIGNAGTGPGEFQQPAGLALDVLNRLWVSDYANHRVQVFGDSTEDVLVIDATHSSLDRFNFPNGLLPQSDGSVLVADYGNHRVIRISQEGVCSVVSSRIGRNPDENWYPISFVADRDENVWLVELGNHRVKKLSPAGTHLDTVGRCGLGKGFLFSPVSAAVFDDGVFAIAQIQLDQCLKLFSSSGDELARLALDYYPSGMVIRGGTLFVAAYDGNSIHLYER